MQVAQHQPLMQVTVDITAVGLLVATPHSCTQVSCASTINKVNTCTCTAAAVAVNSSRSAEENSTTGNSTGINLASSDLSAAPLTGSDTSTPCSSSSRHWFVGAARVRLLRGLARVSGTDPLAVGLGRIKLGQLPCPHLQPAEAVESGEGADNATDPAGGDAGTSRMSAAAHTGMCTRVLHLTFKVCTCQCRQHHRDHAS